jgi:hypothetical protein
MSLWAASDLEAVAKTVLYLLKNQFMKASNYDEMRKVFLDGPSKLYTSDIQTAFMYLCTGRKENEIASLNKRDKENNLNRVAFL